jgi:hypothetical protein
VGTLSKWISAIGAAFRRPTEHDLPPASPALRDTDDSGVEGAVAEDAVVKGEAVATVAAEDQAAATVEVEDAAATVAAGNEAATVAAEAEDEAVTVEPEDESVPAEVERSQDTPAVITSGILPDQQEIQRRRELVRALFNDFWKGNDEKPATFVDRLNQAEGYLNERLTERGEPWQLDAATRKMLGLPPRAN